MFRKDIIADRVNKVIDKKIFYVFLFFFYFISTFVLYWKAFVGNCIPASGDANIVNNMFYLASESLQNGRVPLWNPYLTAGRPYINDITNAFFYPFRFVFSFLKPTAFFYTFYSFHISMGSVFFALYLKELKCQKVVSILSSAAYYFSICLGGFRKGHITLICCMVYLPLILFLIEKYYRTEKVCFLYYCSLAMALQFLVGFPQMAVYTDLVAGFYIIALEVVYKKPFLKWLRQAIAWGLFYLGFILIEFIPFVEMYLTYSKYGASETSFETFKSYSVNPIKVLMMLCPKMFCEDPNATLLQLGSSEIQVELFLGTVTFSLIIYSLIKHIRDYRVIIAAIFGGGTFLFSCCGEIDFLANIIYRIPLIGAFRCSSRSLFIYVFFGLTLAAIALSSISEESDYRCYLFIVVIEVLFVLSVCVATTSVSAIIGTDGKTLDTLINRYSKTIVVLLLSIGFTLFCMKSEKKNSGLFVLVSVLLIVSDIFPYWKQSAYYNMDSFGPDTEVESFMVTHKDEGKWLLASPYIDGTYQSALAEQSAISLGVQGINTYANMNDPRLSKLFTSESIVSPSFNFSGLYTGFPEIRRNLVRDNDLISMLGIKYILDQEDLVPKGEYMEGAISGYGDILLSVPEMTIEQSEEVRAYGYCIPLVSNKYYMVSFDCDAQLAENDMIYVDFYGGPLYDLPDQQIAVEINGIDQHYDYIMYSGIIPDSVENTEIRIVTGSIKSPLSIKNYTVKEMISSEVENQYVLVYETENVKIYENKNCRPIIYCVDRVERIQSEETIYGKNDFYDFDSVAYVVENVEGMYSLATIDGLTYDTNRFSACVKAPSQSFIVLSQTYYPGWRVYVDGERAPLYEVNGYIQGCIVPQGEHIVEFRFIPISVLIGIVCALTTFSLWVLVIVRSKRKQR